MKTLLKPTLFALLLLGAILASQIAYSQAPPPPPSEKGTGSNKAPGGGAALGGGILTLLTSVAGYAAWKLRKRKQE